MSCIGSASCPNCKKRYSGTCMCMYWLYTCKDCNISLDISQEEKDFRLKEILDRPKIELNYSWIKPEPEYYI